MSALGPEKALIFRIVHVRNIPWILDHGLHCRNSTAVDPHYINIGSPSLIELRKSRTVPIAPGGTLADYIPFYFTPYSIMLYNIKTGHASIRSWPSREIAILVSSLQTVQSKGIPFVFTNQHAYPVTAEYFNSLSDLHRIDWKLLQAKDFRHDPEDPGKKERYQAEALIHQHLPVDALLGLACHDATTSVGLQSEVEKRNLKLKIVAQPSWYF
jgi:hypothetical protein